MIRGKRILLRTVRQADLDQVYALLNDIQQHGGFLSHSTLCGTCVYEEIDETGWWEAELGRLLITDPEQRILGLIMFLKPSTFRDTYEIGFVIFKPEDRGQGYMTEAVSLFVPYLFELKNVNRIESITLSENVAAQQVFKKCGFKHEGTLRQTLFHRGQFKDMEIFSILRNETDSLSWR